MYESGRINSAIVSLPGKHVQLTNKAFQWWFWASSCYIQSVDYFCQHQHWALQAENFRILIIHINIQKEMAGMKLCVISDGILKRKSIVSPHFCAYTTFLSYVFIKGRKRKECVCRRVEEPYTHFSLKMNFLSILVNLTESDRIAYKVCGETIHQFVKWKKKTEA